MCLITDDPSTTEFPATTSWYPAVAEDLAVVVENKAGLLSGRVEWTSEEDREPVTKVMWGRTSCRIKRWLPECHLPQDSFLALVLQDQVSNNDHFAHIVWYLQLLTKFMGTIDYLSSEYM